MSDILHGRHEKMLTLIRALGIPEKGLCSFELSCSVEDIARIKCVYNVDGDDVDTETIEKTFGMFILEPEQGNEE